MSILDQFLLTDRVAIVTGAGRGIGAAIARAFADAGADVALCARSREGLENVADYVRARGRRALVVAADVNDLGALAGLVERTAAELGRIDVLVNNAGGLVDHTGGSSHKPFFDVSSKTLEETFHFNVTTAFELTKLVTPHLLRSGAGSVINMSSGVGRFARRGAVSYGTSKAAVIHMTRLLAQDLAPRIRVNCIAPGAIATDALAGTIDDDEMRREMNANVPLHRIGTPDDIAAAAVWLASPAGSYMTGKIIEIDGGLQVSVRASKIPDL